MKEKLLCGRRRTALYTAALLAAVLLAAAVSAALLTGCGGGGKTGAGTLNGKNDSSGSRLQVVTTIFPQYDFARQIAGDRADVYMLLKPGEEVHSYEPTPMDIKMIQTSDLFIYTGGENDVWVDSILESVGDSGPEAVRLLDLVDTYAEEALEGMMPEKGGHDHSHEARDHDHEEEEAEETHDHDHEEEAEETHDHEEEEAEEIHDHEEEETEEVHDHDHEEEAHEAGAATGTIGHGHMHGGEPDEHVWTSPENCVILIEKLTDLFCEADPGNAETYRENGDAYRTAFEELDREYREMAESAPGRTILFGDRFPFRYLAEELDLTCYAAFSGCSAEAEPSAATIAFLIDKTAQEELPVVFKIEFSNGNIADAIREAARLRIDRSKQTRIQVLQLHSCHNLTRDEFEAGETCLSLMTRNLEALRTALGAE